MEIKKGKNSWLSKIQTNKTNKRTKNKTNKQRNENKKPGINERVGVRQWKLNMEFIKNCIKIKAQLFKRQIVLTTE